MNRKLVTLSIGLMLLLTACDNPMVFHTMVNEDGSLDRTLVLDKTDSMNVRPERNIFGIGKEKGWDVKITQSADSAVKSDKNKVRIEFRKHFADANAMNAELDQQTDTLFRINAKFEKRFRWFYTYIRYSETIRPVQRFRMVDPKDFFNQEDESFIKRLPAEGKEISLADSVYLLLLNEKISDHFGNMGIYKETYQILEEVVKNNLPGKRWLDTLQKNQEYIYKRIERDKGEHDLAEKIADTLGIPLPKPKSTLEFQARSKDLNTRVDFMGYCRDGRYQSEIEMPWTVVHSNADSVAGQILYWRPMLNKFVYMDYEMFAESRKMNVWAVALSGVVVILTGWVMVRRRRGSGGVRGGER